MHREGCPALGLTCRDLQGVYTHRTRVLLTIHAVDGDACALSPFARPSRDQPPASNHPLDLHGSLCDSRCRPAARTGLHTCAPTPRSVNQRVPYELKSKELRGALLSPLTALHSGLHCTQACPSTGTSRTDSQRAQTSPQVMWKQPPDGSHERRRHTRCSDGGSAKLLPSSPLIAVQCTSRLTVDSGDRPELHSCQCEGWDEHLWANSV